MNKLIKLGFLLTFSISALSGCNSNIAAVTDTTNSANTNPSASNNPGNQPMMPPDNFGIQSELKLTTEQTSQLNEIKQASMPQNSSTNFEQIKTTINEAFVADTLTVDTLKTKLNNVTAYDDASLTTEADIILKSYNVLNADQKKILETKNEFMFNNFRANKFIIGFGPDMNTIATELGLNDTQKASFNTLMPTAPDMSNNGTDLTLEQSIGTELKTGTATTDKIKAILKSSSSYTSSVQDEELEKLVKIHDILTADQRKTFISKVSFGGGMGPGGPGGQPPTNGGGIPPVNPNANDIPPGM